MKIKLRHLWHLDGTIDRGTYAMVGVIGFALKHNLDRMVASFIFHRPWGFFNYWDPLGTSAESRACAATMPGSCGRFWRFLSLSSGSAWF
jgi:hypothetical protein